MRSSRVALAHVHVADAPARLFDLLLLRESEEKEHSNRDWARQARQAEERRREEERRKRDAEREHEKQMEQIKLQVRSSSNAASMLCCLAAFACVSDGFAWRSTWAHRRRRRR